MNNPFKQSIEGYWTKWIQSPQQSHQRAQAWISIGVNTQQISFLVCRISNDVDDSEDHLVSDDLPPVGVIEGEDRDDPSQGK